MSQNEVVVQNYRRILTISLIKDIDVNSTKEFDKKSKRITMNQIEMIKTEELRKQTSRS